MISRKKLEWGFVIIYTIILLFMVVWANLVGFTTWQSVQVIILVYASAMIGGPLVTTAWKDGNK